MSERPANRYEVRFKCGTVSQVMAKTTDDAVAVARIWTASFPTPEGKPADTGEVESVTRLD